MRVEKSGFVTFIDNRPAPQQEKIKKGKDQSEKEDKIMTEGGQLEKPNELLLDLEYQKYFKEHVPFSGKSMKHRYTV